MFSIDDIDRIINLDENIDVTLNMLTKYLSRCKKNETYSDWLHSLSLEENSTVPEIIDRFSDQLLGVDFDNDFDVIHVHEISNSDKWCYPELIRYGANGVSYNWQIGWDGKNMKVVHGTDNSQKVKYLTVKRNESGRSLLEQAIIRSRNEFNKKVKSGYSIVGSNIENVFRGMKASPYRRKVKGEWTTAKIHNFPILLTPKLDGVRGLSSRVNGKINMISYSGRSTYETIDHIFDDLELLFDQLPEGTTLDGELYCHKMPLKKIKGIISTTLTRHEELESIEYHIFDIILPDIKSPSEIRYLELLDSYNSIEHLSSVKIVPCIVCNDIDEILKKTNEYINNGYEGSVLRYTSTKTIDIHTNCFDEFIECEDYTLHTNKRDLTRSYYDVNGGRSRMLKFKFSIEEEGKIIDIINAEGSEMNLGVAVILDNYGLSYSIRFGSREERCEWLTYPDKIIGRIITFKHVGRDSETNIPFQPTFKCWRDTL